MYVDEQTYLAHYGVKGMKWGVRKKDNLAVRGVQKIGRTMATGPFGKAGINAGKKINKHNQERTTAKKLKKAQKEYDKNVEKNWYKAYNEAADYMTKNVIPKLNEQYKGDSWSYDKKVLAKYDETFNKIYQQKFDDMFGPRPEAKKRKR